MSWSNGISAEYVALTALHFRIPKMASVKTTAACSSLSLVMFGLLKPL